MSKPALRPATIITARATSSRRSASPARRIRRASPAARAGAPRLPACSHPNPTSSFSTSRRTISTSPPSKAWRRRSRAMRSAIVLISHDRRFLENLSNATVWLDRGATRRLDEGFAAFEAWRDTILEEEERERHKLDRKIVEEEHWLRYGVTARRKRNVGRLARLQEFRREKKRARANRPQGNVALAVQDARQSGKLVIEADRDPKSYGGRADRPRLLDPDRARRQDRHRRAERRRQDDADQPAHRRARPRQRDGPPRRQSRRRLARPAAREPRPGDDGVGGADRRPRRHRHHRRHGAPRRSAT